MAPVVVDVKKHLSLKGNVDHDAAELELSAVVAVPTLQVDVANALAKAIQRDGGVGDKVVGVELVGVVDGDVEEAERLHLGFEREALVEDGVEAVVVDDPGLVVLAVVGDTVDLDLHIGVNDLSLGGALGLGELARRHDLDVEVEGLFGRERSRHRVEHYVLISKGRGLENVARVHVVHVFSVVQVHLEAARLVVEGDDLGADVPARDGVVVRRVDADSGGVNSRHLLLVVLDPVGGVVLDELLGLGLGEGGHFIREGVLLTLLP
mmetsp:Transcript_24333/g.45683  ORF Transcript_24333/g.45683 Transcript_24333/m.45683 type:complete len:265 (+) Transcript_24333:115-909(+)